jgi:hypothetical protein
MTIWRIYIYGCWQYHTPSANIDCFLIFNLDYIIIYISVRIKYKAIFHQELFRDNSGQGYGNKLWTYRLFKNTHLILNTIYHLETIVNENYLQNFDIYEYIYV